MHDSASTANTERIPKFDEHTLYLIRTSVRRSSIASCILNIAHRTVAVIFVVYAVDVFHSSLGALGTLFLVHSVLACAIGGFLMFAGELIGFDHSIQYLLVITLIGFVFMLPTQSEKLVAAGMLFTAASAARTIICQTYITKLAKIGGVVHPSDMVNYANIFFTQYGMWEVLGFMLGPILGGSLYLANPRAPFILGLILVFICTVDVWMFLRGEYAEIISRTHLRTILAESMTTERVSIVRIVKLLILTAAIVCGVMGGEALHVYYIVFMRSVFGAGTAYSTAQLSVRAVIGFLTSAFLKRFAARLNPYGMLLIGGVIASICSLAFYLVGTSADPSAHLSGTWTLMIFTEVGHIFNHVCALILLLETTSREFVSRAAFFIGCAQILAGGVGPYLYGFAHAPVDLLLLHLLLRVSSLCFVCIFVLGSYFSFVCE